MGNWDVELNQARDILRNAAWLGTDEEREQIEKAVELLCGEPCEDAISRQAVLDTLDRMNKVLDEDRTVETYIDLLRECYTVLPSVTPKQRAGWWIDGFGGCECSLCGCLEAGYSDYCPDCGAKMVPQESEGEE